MENITTEDILEREEKIKDRITKFFQCNFSYIPPISGLEGIYDVLMSNFCVECATNKKEEWHKYFVNIASLVKPGGKLLMAVTKEANYYPVGRENFPVVYLTEQDLREALIKSDFDLEQVYIKEVSADNFDRSYKGFMLISAIKLKK